MTYAISADPSQAALRKALLDREFPNGPPMPAGKSFVRFAVTRYACGEAPPQLGIVVRFRYADRPDIGELGGAFVWFEHGRPVNWNLD
jgi:hypothetical protein